MACYTVWVQAVYIMCISLHGWDMVLVQLCFVCMPLHSLYMVWVQAMYVMCIAALLDFSPNSFQTIHFFSKLINQHLNQHMSENNI